MAMNLADLSASVSETKSQLEDFKEKHGTSFSAELVSNIGEAVDALEAIKEPLSTIAKLFGAASAGSSDDKEGKGKRTPGPCLIEDCKKEAQMGPGKWGRCVDHTEAKFKKITGKKAEAKKKEWKAAHPS